VTRYRPGVGLFIQSAQIGLYAETNQKGSIRPGDRVDVIGFVGSDRFGPYLDHATFRKVGEGPEPSPEVSGARDVLTGVREARLVRVRGRLLDAYEGPDEKVLRLSAEGVDFRAAVDATRDTPLPEQAVPGSELDLTGVVYLRELDAHGVPRSFDILMRTLDDLVVVTPAPGWIWTRRLRVYGVPLAVGLAALSLAVTIVRRRRARRRKPEHPQDPVTPRPRSPELDMQATLDGLSVATVMLDLRGQVTFCNARLLQLLDRPRSFVVGCDWDTFLPPDGARDRWRQRFRDAMREGAAPPDDIDELVTRRGQRARLAWWHAPVRDRKGRVVGLMSVGVVVVAPT
jgi:PAS domain-containing protein